MRSDYSDFPGLCPRSLRPSRAFVSALLAALHRPRASHIKPARAPPSSKSVIERARFARHRADLSHPVPEIVAPEVHFFVKVSEGHGLQPFPLSAFEPASQLLDGLVREGVQDSLQVLSDPDIEDALRMTDYEAEVVAVRALHADHLPDERLAAFSLEPEGSQVADRGAHKVLVGQPGLKMQPYLESPMRAKPTASERKPSSDPAAESAGRGAPTTELFATTAA